MKIVLSTILKPVDDVRLYWKLAQSLAKTNKYNVNIIGNVVKKSLQLELGISFFGHSFTRYSFLERITARVKVLHISIRLRPDIYIATSHEVLGIGVLLKYLFGTKLIYDIQENYYLNHAMIESNFLKKGYALLIRLKEYCLSFFYDGFWLAEESYKVELLFLKKEKTLIIENKAMVYSIEPKQRKTGKKQLLFSGTISKYSGILTALQFFENIENKEEFQLLIVGQVHSQTLRRQMERKAMEDPSIILNISRNPLPYEVILRSILQANFGIISYQENRVNKNKVPTKLYEYACYQLPFCIQEHTFWHSKAKEMKCSFMAIDFKHYAKRKLVIPPVTSSNLNVKYTWDSNSHLINDFMDNF